MNIFVLHKDPAVAATMACDKHVVKMILETAQMLCTAARALGSDAPYGATHKKHHALFGQVLRKVIGIGSLRTV